MASAMMLAGWLLTPRFAACAACPADQPFCDTGTVLDPMTQARELIRIVSSDTGLPRYARRRAAGLQPLAATLPSLVLDCLDALRREVVPNLGLQQPGCDYARCVSIDAFWEHNLHSERRAAFVTSKDYLHWLRLQADPAASALHDISAGTIVPAAHSWMVPAANIAGLNGRSLKARLKLSANEPPYLVFVFPAAKLKAAGVRVREPRGVDAVPARHVQWLPGSVPGERIDQDVPYAALGGLQWRP